MWGLEKIADAFDKMHDEVSRDIEKTLLVDAGRRAGEKYGSDSLYTWYTAINAGIAYSLIKFTIDSGKGLVDVLRLGEGVKSGTLTGVGQDTLRVLNIVPMFGMAAKGLGMGGRAISVANATRVTGGSYNMSCGATASAAASRLSGARVTMTLEEVGTKAGFALSPKNPNFTGMSWQQIKTVLRGVTSTTQDLGLNPGSNINTIKQVAAQGRGPVVFGVEWANGGRHAMVAFRNAKGQIMIADQFGVRPIANAGLFNGTSHGFRLTEALLVGDGIIMQGVSQMEKAGATILGNAANRSFLTATLGLEMVVVNSKTTIDIDNAIREKLGRQPRDWKAGQNGNNKEIPASGDGNNKEIPTPAVIPSPQVLSPTLQQDSLLVLNKLPQNGDSREFAQLMMETGLSAFRVRDALLQLMRSGFIQIIKWVSYENKPTPGMVKRVFRR